MESVTWGKVGHPQSAKILAMIPLLRHCLGWLIAAFRSREDLILENFALRQQLFTLHAKRPRPRLGSFDKLFWVALRKVWPGWRTSLILVTPQTVIRWHRTGFRLHWTWLSRRRVPFGRKPIGAEVREVIFVWSQRTRPGEHLASTGSCSS